MPFKTGSGRIAPVRPKKRLIRSQVSSAISSSPKERAEATVKREFPKIISQELPRGFTGGANITSPKIVTSLKSGGFGQTKPTSKKVVRFGRDVQPKTQLVAGAVNDPGFGPRLIRHEIGHQVLGQQGVPDKAQEPIVRITRVAPLSQQLKLLPAATRFFTSKESPSRKKTRFFKEAKTLFNR